MGKKGILFIIISYYGFITYQIYKFSTSFDFYVNKLPLPQWQFLDGFERIILLGVYGLLVLLTFMLIFGIRPKGIFNKIFNIALLIVVGLFSIEIIKQFDLFGEINTDVDYTIVATNFVGVFFPFILYLKKRARKKENK